MSARAKARAERTLALARALLEEQQVNVREQVELVPLAHILKERAGVSYDTARRHVHRAVMLARGDLSRAPQWGGLRGNKGGRPRREQVELKSITIRQDTPLMISQVYPDGTADLGRGKAQVKRTPAGRMIVIPQSDGSEIRILVF